MRVGRSATHVVLMQLGEQRGHVQNRVLVVLVRALLQPVLPEEVEQARVHRVRLAEEKHVVQHGRQHVDDRLEILSVLIAKIDGRGHVVNRKKRHFAANLKERTMQTATSWRKGDSEMILKGVRRLLTNSGSTVTSRSNTSSVAR